MSVYTLNVNIDPEQIDELKNSGFSLLLGKVVNGVTNVIWQSREDFLNSNKFQWTETYSVAGLESFATGTLVSASTAVKNIGFGQTATVDAHGKIGQPTGLVDKSGTFTFANNKLGADLAVAVYVGTFDPTNAKTLPTPVYVSKPIEAGFTGDLTPIETVVAWFGMSEKTSTIISKFTGPTVQVVYEGETSHTLSWSKVNGVAGWQQTN